MGMAELIDKWEVVNKLIRLENQYNFYKKKWDADVLYRRICELEIGIGKAEGLEVVLCKDCKHYFHYGEDVYGCRTFGMMKTKPDGFCSQGERKDNERKAD